MSCLWGGEADFSTALRSGRNDGSLGLGLRERAGAIADPPFDFAQGRLFGDDNQKDNSRSFGDATRKTIATADPLLSGDEGEALNGDLCTAARPLFGGQEDYGDLIEPAHECGS
jgi:hypothetical protein